MATPHPLSHRAEDAAALHGGGRCVAIGDEHVIEEHLSEALVAVEAAEARAL